MVIPKDYLIKYIFRFFHIGPVIALSGKIISDYLFGSDGTLTSRAKAFYAINGILLIIAGFVNLFLLKPKINMGPKAKLWIGIGHIKFLISLIFFTPLVNIFADQKTKTSIQFWFVVLFIFVSPFMRYYREYHTSLQTQSNQAGDTSTLIRRSTEK